MHPLENLTRVFCIAIFLVAFNFKTLRAQQLDPSFKSSVLQSAGNLLDVKTQPDGKILLAGDFLMYDNGSNAYLERINQNGTIDESFNIGTGFSHQVSSVLIQSDGKIIVLGYFTTFDGQPVKNLVRLNSNGSIDASFSVENGFDLTPNAMAIQDDGKIIFVGNFTSYNAIPCSGIVRLNENGTIDHSFMVGSITGGVPYIVKIQNDQKILIAGNFKSVNGVSKATLCRLKSDGSLDESFDAITGAPDAGYVSDVALQADGKILVAGSFITFNGISKKNIVKLNADGTIDQSFNTSTDQSVERILVTADNSIVITGIFSIVNGADQRFYARLNSDGALLSSTARNHSMHPRIIAELNGNLLMSGNEYVNDRLVFRLIKVNTSEFIQPFNTNAILNNPGGISTAAVQKSGKIIVGGMFSSYNGTLSRSIVRINRDGSLDTSFKIGTGPNSYVSAVALQADDKILVGGLYTAFQNKPTYRIARLMPDGVLDPTFATPTSDIGVTHDIKVQSDGKIILGGDFPFPYNGVSVKNIFRINSNGEVDPTFNVGEGPNSYINLSLLQPDGKIIVFGNFKQWSGSSVNNIVRLNSDGTLDNSFSVGNGPNNGITCAALAPDGKIYVGGYFINFDGRSVPYFTRLNADGSLDYSFNPSLPNINSWITSIVVVENGKIIVGKGFAPYQENVGSYLLKLNSDGSEDTDFVFSGPDQQVDYIFKDIDQRILFFGKFKQVNALPRCGMAAILPNIPAPPTELNAQATGTHSVALTWLDNSDNESGFEIERSLGGSTPFQFVNTVAYNASTYADHGLAPGTLYSYRLKSVNSAGGSSYAVQTVATLPFPAPTNLSAVRDGMVIKLLWQDNTTGENRFVIERSINNANHFSKVDSVDANATIFAHTIAESESVLYYRLRAANADGYSAYSEIAQIKIDKEDNVVTALEYINEPVVTIQYNPALHEFVVHTPWMNGFTLTVHDRLGRVIYERISKTDFLNIDMSSQSIGMYILKTSSSGKTCALKIFNSQR